MLRYYRTADGKLLTLEKAEEGCWINAVNPNENEITTLSGLGLDPNLLHAALDEEEQSRIESLAGQTLMIYRLPVADNPEAAASFSTMPVGFLLTDHYVVTVCPRQNPVLAEFEQGLVKNVATGQRVRFMMFVLLRITLKYLQYLRQIDKISNYIEKQLHGSMNKTDLMQLTGIQKSLIYFAAALKANEITLEKILRGRIVKIGDEDIELLEDVLIETKQAVEMAGVYLRVLTGTMNAMGPIISNNITFLLRFLISFVVLVTVPAAVFLFYGFVIGFPILNFGYPLILSAVLMVLAAGLLYQKRIL